jgi:hypothetical protein
MSRFAASGMLILCRIGTSQAPFIFVLPKLDLVSTSTCRRSLERNGMSSAAAWADRLMSPSSSERLPRKDRCRRVPGNQTPVVTICSTRTALFLFRAAFISLNESQCQRYGPLCANASQVSTPRTTPSSYVGRSTTRHQVNPNIPRCVLKVLICRFAPKRLELKS